ncbi:MAG: hypothetical protein ACOYIC_07900 [Butyricicoccus sp.]|jgi:hypothetical protein
MRDSADCPCKRTKCERHGDCDACREHHHSKGSGRKALTRCEKLEKKVQRKAERQKRKM